METSQRLSLKGRKLLSNLVVSVFAAISAVFFLIVIDRTLTIIIITVLMLAISLYLMWAQSEHDSISLLIFFFGTTACYYFFSEVATAGWLRALSIAVFAGLSLVLSHNLINAVKTEPSPERTFYKIVLAIVFTEIFWVSSFFNASAISKGALAAVVFFNFVMIVKDFLVQNFQVKKFAFLAGISIILLAIVIYRI